MSLTAALGLQFLVSFTSKDDLLLDELFTLSFQTKSLNLVNFFFETVDLEGG